MWWLRVLKYHPPLRCCPPTLGGQFALYHTSCAKPPGGEFERSFGFPLRSERVPETKGQGNCDAGISGKQITVGKMRDPHLNVRLPVPGHEGANAHEILKGET